MARSRTARRPRILVIARGHLGDIVATLPVFRDLRLAYPNAKIVAFVNEYVRGIFDGCPYVDGVIYGFGYEHRGTGARLWHRFRTMLRIVAAYDIAICLRLAPPTGTILALASGARVRAGYRQPGLLGKLLTHDGGDQPADLPNRLLNTRLLELIGVDSSMRLPSYDWGTPSLRARTQQLLYEHGLDRGQPFAVLQVSSHWGCYEWRSDKWAALADSLVERHDLQPVIIGSDEPFEVRKTEEISERMRHRPVVLVGQTTIPQLIDIVGQASLVVACDSALTQISLLQRTPSVVLFGIEPIAPNGPLRSEGETFMACIQHWEGPDLAPPPNSHCRFGESLCHTAACRENSSLAQTCVEEVEEQIAHALADEGASLRQRGSARV